MTPAQLADLPGRHEAAETCVRYCLERGAEATLNHDRTTAQMWNRRAVEAHDEVLRVLALLVTVEAIGAKMLADVETGSS